MTSQIHSRNRRYGNGKGCYVVHAFRAASNVQDLLLHSYD